MLCIYTLECVRILGLIHIHMAHMVGESVVN